MQALLDTFAGERKFWQELPFELFEIVGKLKMPMHKEYRVEWERAGYSSKMGSAEVLRPPAAEWIRLYHITTADFAMNNVALRRLKVARFLDLNDPFELLALNLRDKPKATRRRLAELKTTYDTSTGLLCFSANWTNPVLWSHYGNKHRGICLGFDLRRGLEERFNYEDDRIRDRIGNDSDPFQLTDALKRKLMCTKFDHWKYEEEIRLFVPLDDTKLRKEAHLHFYPFNSDLVLREVILGPQCSMPLDGVRRLVDASYAGVTVIKARLAVGSFNVVPTEKTVP
jgi:hypothetical protein